MEEEKEEGVTSPVPYFITTILVVNIDYPNYKDILWIDYVYNNCAFNRYCGLKAFYNHFPNI